MTSVTIIKGVVHIGQITLATRLAQKLVRSRLL